jgi:dihydroxy-acid dehydratase
MRWWSLIRKQLRPARHRDPQGAGERGADRGRTGGSTNAVLHLPAIAHEAGIDFPLEEVARLMRDTPHIADLKPGGRYVAKDVHDIGGVPVIIKALLDGGLLHGDCMTVTGKTLAENHAEVTFPTNQDVVRR